MKTILIFLSVLLFVGCNGVGDKKSANTSTANSQKDHDNRDAAVVPASVAKNNPSVKLVKNPQQDVNPEEAQFPFDIKLKDADGVVKNSSEVFKQNGKPTVLLFWLTTCGPCHSKLKAIKPVYPEWQKEADFNVYAISGDFAKNYPKFVKQTKAKNWAWETYNDVDRKFKEVLPGRLNGYPQTFIFDKNGKLVYQDKKYRFGDEKRLFEKIKEICNS